MKSMKSEDENAQEMTMYEDDIETENKIDDVIQQQDDISKDDIKPIIEFSFGTFWNWFLPSCLDVWSSTSISNPEIVIAYGAKSFLFLADVFSQKSTKTKIKNANQKKNGSVRRDWKIHHRDIVNVFGYKPKSLHSDIFRSNSNYITTVVFDKTFSLIRHGSSSTNQRNTTNCAMLFLGNSEGVGALYDCHRRITLLQNLPFSSISKPCCKLVTQKKILSAAWLHYQAEGPVVYYTLDTHVIVWKVKKNEVKIFHDNEQDCSNSRFNFAQLQIACLASLPAECCNTDNSEHKLAIGYMGGKIVIIGLDPITGDQTSSFTMFTENSHNDDICSLSFSSYSLSSHSSYQQGLLCSVSRDSVLKVWSCSNQNEIAEYRIIHNYNSGGTSNSKTHGTSSPTNWFAAAFLPRSVVSSNVAYEILLSNNLGDLLTFTLPEKGSNSKLRIGKTQKTFQPKMKKNQMINHTFIIFSIAINFEQKIAVTISLDYKLILWDLSTRISGDVFYSFSNGALGIDACLSDKRIAIAFGSNISVLDFVLNPQSDQQVSKINSYDVNVQRLTMPFKTKFYNIIWNRKYFERLGRLIIGTLEGELIHYDLTTKDVIMKSNKSNCRDSSKIYSIIWLDYLFPINDTVVSVNDDGNKNESQNPIILTLHQSGKIMVNYLVTNQPQENLDKYLVGLPESQKVKRTAMQTSYSQRYLLIGNDDGTIDVFCRIPSVEQYPEKVFRHMYRFRSFNRPCISIEYCSNTNWLAITALHEQHINCYHIEDLDHFSDNDDSTILIQPNDSESKINVKTIPLKCRLTGHEERVSFTCWSPFNRLGEEDKILLASSSYDTTCIVWNVVQKLALKRFFGHKSLVYIIKWCHFSSEYIFSGSEDNFFFWNWTIQPDFSPNLKATDNYNVKINSLRTMLEKNVEENYNDLETKPNTINDTFDQTMFSLDLNVNKLKTNSLDISTTSNKTTKTTSNKTTKTTSIRALFPFSNQIENNSSKYERLDDIKWLIKLKRKQSESEELDIPPNKLDRILLYGNFDHIQRMLQLEIDCHKSNKNIEGQYMLSLLLNTRNCIEKSVEQNECDPILTILASGLSKKLFTDCMKNILGEPTLNNNERQLVLTSKIKWVNYSRELSALMRLCCLNDFQGSIDSLLSQNLYREAIILSVINLAADSFVFDLMYQWHKYRLQQNNYEGAIKCLIASKHYSEALKLLKLRRTLCFETSGNSTLKQYDEAIEMLNK